MTPESVQMPDLPAGLVVFSADGKAQFGWQHPDTGAFHSEADGNVIADAVGGVAWHAAQAH